MNFAACKRQRMIVRDCDQLDRGANTCLNLSVRDVSMGDSCIAYSPKIAESDVLAPGSHSSQSSCIGS